MAQGSEISMLMFWPQRSVWSQRWQNFTLRRRKGNRRMQGKFLHFPQIFHNWRNTGRGEQEHNTKQSWKEERRTAAGFFPQKIVSSKLSRVSECTAVILAGKKPQSSQGQNLRSSISLQYDTEEMILLKCKTRATVWTCYPSERHWILFACAVFLASQYF